MDAKLRCDKPGDIEYTVTITMKAKDWKDFRDQLENKWPSSEFAYQIDSLLTQANKIYWPEPKKV